MPYPKPFHTKRNPKLSIGKSPFLSCADAYSKTCSPVAVVQFFDGPVKCSAGSGGSVMQGSSSGRGGRLRSFNAVCLQNAVLCAECDCVSDSPHDKCLVCGSHSLFNISRVLGGSLPTNRAAVIEYQSAQSLEEAPEFVLNFPRAHKIGRAHV